MAPRQVARTGLPARARSLTARRRIGATLPGQGRSAKWMRMAEKSWRLGVGRRNVVGAVPSGGNLAPRWVRSEQDCPAGRNLLTHSWCIRFTAIAGELQQFASYGAEPDRTKNGPLNRMGRHSAQLLAGPRG